MTDYTDLPQINSLYQQRQTVTMAIAMIDNSGSLTNFTVSPATAAGFPSSGAPAQVAVPAAGPELLAAVRDWLVQRQAEIDTQLSGLGVAGTPPSTLARSTRNG